MSIVERLLEKDIFPDPIIRLGIRRLLRDRLREEDAGNAERQRERLLRFVDDLRASPIAIETKVANDQHYEIPAEFFLRCLGPQRKYSSAYWPDGVSTLADAEQAMLDLTCFRARLEDGQDVLELGCGWGSLSLYMARRFPGSQITAVSNSHSQKAFYRFRTGSTGLTNLEIVTVDMNQFETDRKFDRMVSVEMFEHMRNYQELMRRIALWSKPRGLLFVHIFTHREFAYAFEDRGTGDWMARHFFYGGIMPSDDLLLHFQDDFAIREHWRLDGTHYQKTAEAWLDAMDSNRWEIWMFSNERMVWKTPFAGSFGGESFLWPAQNYGATAGVPNGWSLTTCLRRSNTMRMTAASDAADNHHNAETRICFLITMTLSAADATLPELQQMMAKFAPVDLRVDTSKLIGRRPRRTGEAD